MSESNDFIKLTTEISLKFTLGSAKLVSSRTELEIKSGEDSAIDYGQYEVSEADGKRALEEEDFYDDKQEKTKDVEIEDVKITSEAPVTKDEQIHESHHHHHKEHVSPHQPHSLHRLRVVKYENS